MSKQVSAVRIAAVVAGTVLMSAIPSSASAQYFGRNKVQYETFDFRVLNTEHFRIYYYPAEAEAVRDAARMAERWEHRYERLFNHKLTDVKPMVLYADHPDFQQTNTTPETLGEGTGGFTEGLKDRVVLPLTGSYRDTDHVIGHELVHSFQYDIAKARGALTRQGMGSLPLWLIEGMAEYLSLGREDTNTAMWLRDAALRGDLPTIEQLTTDPRFFPYRYGQALWAYIGGRWGDRTVTELYKAALDGGWPAAVRRYLGLTPDQLSTEWLTTIRATYLPLMEGRQRPGDIAQKVLARDIDAGEMNVSPAVSPDGRYVAFYKEDLFDVKLYLADANTGKMIHQLVSSQSNVEFDALSFLNSAGAWSPDEKKFAFTVFSGGDNALAIVDVGSRKVERRIRLKDVGAVHNPAWSPDGRRIAFSGMKGGMSDLYVLDLETNRLEQLTDDKYADLQPAWSPDGKTLAFVTDRGPETDFRQLKYGPMHLALMDMRTRNIRLLDIFRAGKHINPQFSPDGESLYFISDADGFDDIFRLALDTGRLYRVTRLATGVSGITNLSPALTVAQQEGRVMFSVFTNGDYVVYGMEADAAQGTPVDPLAANASTDPPVAGVLPPVEGLNRGVIAAYLDDPGTGLLAAEDFAVKNYHPSLSLDYVGVPMVGVAVTPFGTGVAGAAAAYFSDILGNRSLGVAVQANGTVKDIGGQVVYQNMKHQWNWGVGGGRVPYQLILPQIGMDTMSTSNGPVPALVEQILRLRIYQDQALVMTEYPFSKTMRLEFGGGYTHYGFSLEADRIYFDPSTGQQIGRNRQDLDVLQIPGITDANVNLATASVALVGDWSDFGFTAPIRGGRYRLQVVPTFGELQYMTLVADYRRYFFHYPFTLAFRGLHYARYGKDADQQSFLVQPFYLPDEYYIRGYAPESWDVARECVTAPAIAANGSTGQDACANWSALLGSRLAVMNLELRIPLIGVPQYGLLHFPFLPTELAAFVDAGVAWTGAQAPSWEWIRDPRSPEALNAQGYFKRYPVASVGVAARVNVLGFLIFETYYAYPFQRPDKGWHLGFQIMPGW
ncbi:MAG: peptidase S9 [Gemmatimonadota bacterium]